MTVWQPYSSTPHTVVGTLLTTREVHSPQLGNVRDIFVWLPPAYADETRRFPVVYMHDGLNLFDRYTSYSGEWEVDETMTALSAEGLDAIIVGLPNMSDGRAVEYCPYPFINLDGTHTEGRGDAYVRFIVDTVKPLIDAAFRTKQDASATGIAGSSMGGLISLYAALTYPDVFGMCGAFSPAYWFGNNGLLETARTRASGSGRVYLDVGTREGETLNRWLQVYGQEADDAYTQGVCDLRDVLASAGYRPGVNLMYVEESDATHREDAWARRFPAAMRFLLG